MNSLRSSANSRLAFSLVECVIAIGVVGVVIVGSLQLTASVHASQRADADRARAVGLAQAMLSEILTRRYEEVDDVPVTPAIGKETGETTDRTTFDDIDDYHNLVENGVKSETGSAVPGLADWQRTVSVEWVKSDSPSESVSSDEGRKRITVTCVSPTGYTATLTAVRSAGFPVGEDPLPGVLLVVQDAGSLGPSEQTISDLLESWDFKVEVIDDNAAASEFETAAARNDVVYVAGDVSDSALGIKVRDLAVGVVNEEKRTRDQVGFDSSMSTETRTQIRIYENGHYITSPFAKDSFVTVSTIVMPLATMDGTLSPDLFVLAECHRIGANYNPSLAIIEPDKKTWDELPTYGRRVNLPWGDQYFPNSFLTEDGLTIMRRSVEWAAGLDAPQ